MEKKKNLNQFIYCRERQVGTASSSFKSLAELSKSLVKNNIIYNLNNTNIPRWKDLSKVQKVGLFFNYIVDESWYAITLRFSDKFVAGCISNSKITDFIRRRINENFKNRLGYVPEYLFSIEFSKGSFHIHGAIKPDGNIDIIKKILKTTAFSKKSTHVYFPEQYKLRCVVIYDPKGWGRYILKNRNHPKFDIYICTPITQKIAKKYRELISKQSIREG